MMIGLHHFLANLKRRTTVFLRRSTIERSQFVLGEHPVTGLDLSILRNQLTTDGRERARVQNFLVLEMLREEEEDKQTQSDDILLCQSNPS